MPIVDGGVVKGRATPTVKRYLLTSASKRDILVLLLISEGITDDEDGEGESGDWSVTNVG